jgi:hypothetical protein
MDLGEALTVARARARRPPPLLAVDGSIMPRGLPVSVWAVVLAMPVSAPISISIEINIHRFIDHPNPHHRLQFALVVVQVVIQLLLALSRSANIVIPLTDLIDRESRVAGAVGRGRRARRVGIGVAAAAVV